MTINNNGEDEGGGFVLSGKVTRSNSIIRKDSSEARLSKVEALKAFNADKEQERRIHENERIKAQEELNEAMGDDANKVVIMPTYTMHPRYKVDIEDLSPPKEIYMGLGWDEDSTTCKKHYRHFYNDELENIKEVFPE